MNVRSISREIYVAASEDEQSPPFCAFQGILVAIVARGTDTFRMITFAHPCSGVADGASKKILGGDLFSRR